MLTSEVPTEVRARVAQANGGGIMIVGNTADPGNARSIAEVRSLAGAMAVAPRNAAKRGVRPATRQPKPATAQPSRAQVPAPQTQAQIEDAIYQRLFHPQEQPLTAEEDALYSRVYG